MRLEQYTSSSWITVWRGPYLSAAEINTIRTWLNQGAKNN
jgi:hypothetical protein